MTHNFIGGKWEEVELGGRNRILFWGEKYWRQMGGGRAWGEEPDTFSEGRNIGGKWEEGKEKGAQNFGNPWDVNVSEGEMLEKILGRVGRVRSSYTGESLGRKGPSARQTNGLLCSIIQIKVLIKMRNQVLVLN